MKTKSKLYIGTSGWIYSDWDGIFYPKDLPPKEKLRYFSRHFKTAEINYSFYHLPRPSTYENWYNQTPDDFVFAVKASRFITHIKRLKGVKTAWKTFLTNALHLKEKLGPILFQFPPSFKATDENIRRLEAFLKFICVDLCLCSRKLGCLRFAFEFRHISWRDDKIYKLLRKYNVAWVVADSPRYPILRPGSGQEVEASTADFIYVRMHGSEQLFSSKYTGQELKVLADKIRKWLKSGDVYVYFNNDFHGFAVENAETLLNII